jgi:hypothetical protein
MGEGTVLHLGVTIQKVSHETHERRETQIMKQTKPQTHSPECDIRS